QQNNKKIGRFLSESFEEYNGPRGTQLACLFCTRPSGPSSAVTHNLCPPPAGATPKSVGDVA
ncbi:MAG: hypothetical protein ACTSXX_02115, partial [Candidatus Baldrarchaeia archaeon]